MSTHIKETSLFIEPVKKIILEARSVFISNYYNNNHFKLKDERDPVSLIDIQIETIIRDRLQTIYPKIPVVGEELSSKLKYGSKIYWTIDPIDGTVNYLNKIPLCGISIALIVDELPIFGCIDFPILNQLYIGGKGFRSTINDVSIEYPNNYMNFSECIVAVGDYSTGSNSVEKNKKHLKLHQILSNEAYRIRMIGSAALDLSWVSSGQIGASITLSNNSWDMAAGVIIAQGSGAYVVDQNGRDYSVKSRCVIVSRRKNICEKLCEIVSLI